MKILVLNGSPRRNKSNSMKITNAFVEGLGENNQVDIIDVSKLDFVNNSKDYKYIVNKIKHF